MKKVLILTAGYGEGHNTAARNVRAAIESIAPDEADAKVLDPLATAYGSVNDFARRAYIAAINHFPLVWSQIYEMLDDTNTLQENLVLLGGLRKTLENLLDSEQPDAVVSTYPVYNYLINEIYARRNTTRPFKQITIVTDSITINSVWYKCGSDAFLVPNEDTRKVFLQVGVAPELVHVLGFPVSLKFTNRPSERARPQGAELWRVLYVINSGKADAPEIVQELLKMDHIQLQVTVGRDEDLRKEIEGVAAKAGKDVEIFGWTDQLPELMCQAHLLISKAGGATVQESLAAKTPLVMTQVVPGQEEGNARLLINNGCGHLAPTSTEIVRTVHRAFADDGALWSQWHANIALLSRPEAALKSAEFVLSHELQIEVAEAAF